MRLVDDLMEPFRPVIDWTVWQLEQKGLCEINVDTKRELVNSLYQDMQTDAGTSPVMVAVQKLATSLAQVMVKERVQLDLPHPGVPVERTATGDF